MVRTVDSNPIVVPIVPYISKFLMVKKE